MKKYTQEEFLELANKKHNFFYTYNRGVYINNSTKITITCPSHGDFEQIAGKHILGSKCPKCMHEKSSLDQRSNSHYFIEKAKNTHGHRYDYSKVNYINKKTKVNIVCLKHKEFSQTPGSHLKSAGCPRCKTSKGELAIEAILDKHNIISEPQYKLPFYKYEYDFYLPDYNLFIEFHGIQHYKYIPFFHNNCIEDFKYQQDRDKTKIELAKEYKISMVVFNYKHLKQLSFEDFEKHLLKIINSIKNRKIKHWIYYK